MIYTLFLVLEQGQHKVDYIWSIIKKISSDILQA